MIGYIKAYRTKAGAMLDPNMKMRVIVSALIKKDGRYLFMRQTKPGGAYPNNLHIPGGGLEPGEDPDEAVRREILEETNVTVNNLSRFDFDYDIVDYKGAPTQLIFLRYLCDWCDGIAQAGSDASHIVWLSQNELREDDHNPPSLRLLKKLGLV